MYFGLLSQEAIIEIWLFISLGIGDYFNNS